MKYRFTPVLLVIVALILATPFYVHLAGDAQVHLVVAERFAAAQPFEYNPGGEQVVASTSPFWTILLTLLYTISGHYTPLLLKIIVTLIWLAIAGLLYLLGRRGWQHGPYVALIAPTLWLLHSTITANALSGLENVLSALQLLLLYCWLAYRHSQRRTLLDWRTAAGAGALWGWTTLTRPDGGLLGAVVLAIFYADIIVKRRHVETTGKMGYRLAVTATVGGVAAAMLLIPWMAYQYGITGNLVTDSSLARLYAGRQGSIPLIPGAVYLHPKALISLATAFLPVTAGFALFAVRWVRHSGSLSPPAPDGWTTLLVPVTAILFYTFGVGAEAFGRYFLPVFPFLFLGAVQGYLSLYEAAPSVRRPGVRALLFLALLVFFLGSMLDLYRRLGPGRYAPEPVLNVLYGPAAGQYYAANQAAVERAPLEREEVTNSLLRTLGSPERPVVPVRFAVTEVQLRYYLDGRVDILSLDGRASQNILPYFDPDTGVPDFEAYFLATQPDYVHVAQWCRVGGWLAYFGRGSTIEDNLVCHWERRTAEMDVGESFTWQDLPVTLVAPELVHIEWNGE